MFAVIHGARAENFKEKNYFFTNIYDFFFRYMGLFFFKKYFLIDGSKI